MAKIKVNLETDATIDVDVQPTFMPSGGLPVAGGDEIVPVIQRVNRLFPVARRFATLDRHPRGHNSLASSYLDLAPYTTIMVADVALGRVKLAPHAKFSIKSLRGYLKAVNSQILWPDHGIIGTPEAFFHPALPATNYCFTICKGSDPNCDSYSGFRDNLKRPTGLRGLLSMHGVRHLFIKGLTYDFCVGWTALDARASGFDEVFVIKDATRTVNLPGTVEAIETAFAEKGVQVINSEDLG